MTRLSKIEEAAKAAFSKPSDSVEIAYLRLACRPSTILEWVALTRQLGEALKYHKEHTRPIYRTAEALAELAKWEE